MQAGHAPLVGTTRGDVGVRLAARRSSYLYVELTTDERSMGAFVAMLLVALAIIPALDPTITPRPPLLHSPLFTVHVMSVLFAYASFALACVLGLTYVLLFKEIKAKQLGFFYARLPSLQVLDKMNGRAITVGWIFLTVGVVVGGDLGDARCSTPPRSAGAGDVDRGSEDPRRAVVAGACIRSRSSPHGVGWSGRRAA